MKKLTILLILALAMAGCGRESEQIDTNAAGAVKDDVRTLTIAWHKVSEADGGICGLSTSTQEIVNQASEQLRQALAPNGIEVVIETLTSEKVEGSDCLCNRVLVQGRFVDEWLGAEMVKTACSGCPNHSGCPNTAASGGICAGQYAMIHQGKTYSIVPAELIVMAGLIAAADLTGEPITYSGCPGAAICKGECTCGKCGGGCVNQGVAAGCSPDCPGTVTGCTTACKSGDTLVGATDDKTAAAAPKQVGCAQAGQCKGTSCPASGR